MYRLYEALVNWFQDRLDNLMNDDVQAAVDQFNSLWESDDNEAN